MPPTDVEVARLLASVRRRIVRLVRRHGIELEGELDDGQASDPLALDNPALAEIQGASVLGRVATGPRAGHLVLRLGCRLLALVIEDVTLLKQRQITAAVRFRGGAATTLTLPRPLTAQQLRATHADVRREIDRLLDEYTDAQVAHLLNERGLSTGAGAAFDPMSVQWVRFSAKLKSLKERLLEAGMVTRRQMCAALGISRTELGRWRQQGRIKARICNDRGEWLYWPPERVAMEANRSPDHVVNSTARGAV
jgi:hypothetical protein